MENNMPEKRFRQGITEINDRQNAAPKVRRDLFGSYTAANPMPILKSIQKPRIIWLLNNQSLTFGFSESPCAVFCRTVVIHLRVDQPQPWNGTNFQISGKLNGVRENLTVSANRKLWRVLTVLPEMFGALVPVPCPTGEIEMVWT